MTPNFTSWPWKIERSQKPPHHLLVLGSKGQSIGLLFVAFPDPTVEQRANADLVEMAPQMFDELVNCAAKLNALGVACPEALIVLAKAGGRRAS